MMGSKFNFSLILKRLTCLNSQKLLQESLVNDKALKERAESNNQKNSEKIYNELKTFGENKLNGKNYNTSYINSLVEKYIGSMSNINSASEQWFSPLSIASLFNEAGEEKVASNMIYGYTTRIMPYMEDTILENIKSAIRYNDVELPETFKKSILETCTLLEGADRILSNHSNLSKRYNMDSLITRYNTSGMKYFIDSCFLRINTYPNLSSTDRIGLVLEESTYILEKYGAEYDAKELLKCAMENYILGENNIITESECVALCNAIDKSIVLDKDDIDYVYDLFGNKPENMSISNGIIQYYDFGEKNISNLISLTKEILSTTSADDILANFDKLLLFVWDVFKNNIITELDCVFNMVGDYINSCTDAMDKLIDNNKNFDKDDIRTLIDQIDKVKDIVAKYGAADVEYKDLSADFNNGLDLLKSKLLEASDILYTSDNINAIKFVASTEAIAYSQYKNSLSKPFVNTAKEFDKFIKLKEQRELDFSNIKDINSTLITNEDVNIDDYIGLDNRADITIRQYAENYNDSSNIVKFAQNIVKEYNDMLSARGNGNYKAYYLAVEGALEIHIKDTRLLNINENQQSVLSGDDLDSMFYINMLENAVKDYDKFGDISDFQLEEYLTDFSKYKKFDKETFDLVVECLKYIDSDSHLMSVFAEKFNEYQFANLISLGEVANYNTLATQEKVVSESVRNWDKKKVEVPYEIQMEATYYLVSLLENLADDWDDVSDEDDDDEEDTKEKKSEKETDKENEDKLRKDPKYNKDAKDAENWKPSRSRSKISLNKLKLGIMGLHDKFKQMNNKEREVSKNLDNSVRALVKSMKGLFVSDRREAIIKGSLVPSFSRCIKNGIYLAGLGIATHGIVIPAIVAVGGIALSKRLTHKEKLLLLDDIETELDVVEKELAIAESNNKMNQYRALLQYKKELQRQYQRIRYNIRVGKDILPSSGTGVGNNNS